MTTFHLRPLMLLDLLVVGANLPDDELDQMTAFGFTGSVEDRAARIWASQGPRWAIAEEGERAVACGGVTPIRPGVVETWFWASPAAWIPQSNLNALVKSAKLSLLTTGTHRIETYSLASRKKAHSWYTFCIGLRCEATLERFCIDGRDAKLFVATVAPEGK